MARWSCGYQDDCNTVLGRNFQSIRNRKHPISPSRSNARSHCHALYLFKPTSMHPTGSCDGLQASHLIRARFCSLGVAISPRMPGISPFMQHTFGRFSLWWVNIFIYWWKYSHTRAISLKSSSHQLKPKADELPIFFLGAFKNWDFLFLGGVCFDLSITSLTWLCLFFICLFATLQKALGFANWKRNLTLHYQSFAKQKSLFCRWGSYFPVYYLKRGVALILDYLVKRLDQREKLQVGNWRFIPWKKAEQYLSLAFYTNWIVWRYSFILKRHLG